MQMFALLLVIAQGVSANNILIGMEGPAQSFSTDEENLGMHLVIKHVNAQGGIHGRKIEVAAYPRGRENIVEQALENVQRLNEEDLVFLLFNFGGPAAVPIGEYAMHNNLPYLFPHTALLTVDGDRHVFTSFPRYAGESRVMLRYLAGTVAQSALPLFTRTTSMATILPDGRVSLPEKPATRSLVTGRLTGIRRMRWQRCRRFAMKNRTYLSWPCIRRGRKKWWRRKPPWIGISAWCRQDH